MNDLHNDFEDDRFQEPDQNEYHEQEYGYMPEDQPPIQRIQMTYEQARTLKTIQRQAFASGICGLVSLFIGGIALSSAGLIVAWLGMRKVKSYDANDVRIEDFLAKLKRLLISSIVVCVIGLGLNAYAVVSVWPDVVAAVQSNDYTQLFDGTSQGDGASDETSTSSTWG